jgi:hypothetical protein
MTQAKCARCQRAISSYDSIAVQGEEIFHVDCRRPQVLNHEERVLLFRYCWDHPVAECAACARKLRQQELASDFLGLKSHLCPSCRTDLTESVRSHLYNCPILPAEVRSKAQAVREVANRLIKDSQQLRDAADVLRAEAEAALAALRETMRRNGTVN